MRAFKVFSQMATEQIVLALCAQSKGRWTALFVHEGGFMEEKKEGEKKSWRINDFQSEWICQKPSALFTLLLSAHGEPEPLGLPTQRETGRCGSPACTSGSQLERGEGGERERGRGVCAIFSVVETLGRRGWYMEKPAHHDSDQWTICCCRIRRGAMCGVTGEDGGGGAPSLSVSVRTSCFQRDCVSLRACVIKLLKQITCFVLMLFKHMHR